MARMRTLKPEAFTSETLAAVSVHARWTFGGLWCYCDDEGRGRANAGLVKAAVWPLDEDITVKHVEQFLDELEAARLLCRYEVDGKGYLHVVNFGEHQHPNRPVESKLPACTRRTHGGLSEHAVSPHTGGPESGGDAVAERPEPRSDRKAAQTTPVTGKHAGQMPLTEDSLSAHGARKAKSSSTPPTPVGTTGVGDGDGEVDGVQQATPAAANGSRPDAQLTITQRSKRITDAYAKAEPLCKWPAVNGVVIRALKTERYSDDEIQAALLRMAGENRSVTVDSLRTELGGMPPRNGGTPGKKTNYTDEEYASGWG